MRVNQKGVAPILILVAAVGIIGFLAIASYAPLKNGLLSKIFPKGFSFAAVLSQKLIYDDALKNGFVVNEFQNPSGTKCMVTPNYTAQKASGTASMEINLNQFCTTILYNPTTINVDDYTDLEFDLYALSPAYPNFEVKVAPNAWSSFGTSQLITDYITPNSTWQHVRIPLSKFGLTDGSQIAGIYLRDENNLSGKGHILLDNIAFTKQDDTTPPTIAAVQNIDLSHVSVTFSEKVTQASAVTAANYSVKLTSGGTAITPSSVSFSSSAKSVTLTLPQALTNNGAYTLTVNNVKDASTNQNTIAPNSTFNFTAQLKTATLTVNASTNINPFTKEMRGSGAVTWMHMSSKPDLGTVPVANELAKQMKLGAIRYAGGNWANAVVWDRTGTSNVDEKYDAGMMDNLYKFKQDTGTEVMIQTNICSNNPAMWADLVKYTNIEHNYGFKYWEVGSENNYATCDDGLTEAQIGARFVAYRDAMKAVDPTIKVVGPASAGKADGWLESVANATHASGKDLDGLIWHEYPSNEGYSTSGCEADYAPSAQVLFNYNTAITNCYETPGYVLPDDHWLMSHRRRQLEAGYLDAKNRILAQSPNTFIGISELNTTAGAGIHPAEGNHVAALWFADMIGRMAYAGYKFNTMYDFYDGTDYALINPNDDYTPTKFSLRPTYYTMLMYGKWFGDQMVQSSTSDSAKQEITLWASKDSADPGKLKLMATNLTGSSVEATINVNGFNPQSGVYYQLTSSDPLNMTGNSAENSGFTSLNGATIDTSSAAAVASSINAITGQPISPIGTSFKQILPPYSATSIVLSTTASSPAPSATPSPSAIASVTPSASPAKPGDIDGNGKVDIFDYNIILTNFGKTASNLQGDLDNNGKVDIFDYNILLTNFGK